MQNIDQQKFTEISNAGEHIIIDVRMPNECANGIIPGARSINVLDNALFSSEIQKLDRDKKYLIYCRSGNRSGRACAMMDTIGFKSTFNLVGGMLAWTGPTE